MLGALCDLINPKKRMTPLFGILHGPNLQALGTREPHVYGTLSLGQLNAHLLEYAQGCGVQLQCVQHSAEGQLIDQLYSWHANEQCQGVVFNPGGLAHTSVALYDAMRAIRLPVVEVHISNVFGREAFRSTLLTAGASVGMIAGLGWQSYVLALNYLVHHAASHQKSA
jgi:3-dehydroquinate dehydratase-2